MSWLLRPKRGLSRRSFIRRSVHCGAVAAAATSLGPMLIRSRSALAAKGDSMLPGLPCGVASGDVTQNGAVIWSRADRPARMIVEYATTDSFADAQHVAGPAALPESDFTAKTVLADLPSGQRIFYRVSFEDLSDLRTMMGPLTGSFRTAPGEARDINFLWSADTAGQGYGINLDWGGMKIYETMRRLQPDFFIHSGDCIYADGPIEAEKTLPDGTIWKNVTTEEKAKVAETLAEFRGNYRYNTLDANVRRFNAEVPQIVQWDDHETLNNWYPTQVLQADDERYRERSVALLSARAKRAFLEYTPTSAQAADPERIHRRIHYGPQLDVFVLDMRSYRGRNSANDQTTPGADTEFLGRRQMAWLKQDLLRSKALWKVIAADMPLGLVVPDGDTAFDNAANGDGPALGREIEIADLLRFIKAADIRNLVWVTADVHHTAAHYYDPTKARFPEFTPFWEFVSGPLNAITAPPGRLDNTFGPQILFQKGAPAGQYLPPSAGLQFFGHAHIEGATGVMTVTLRDLMGAALWSVSLDPERVG